MIDEDPDPNDPLEALRGELDRAVKRDDGTPEARRHRLEAATQLIIALVEEFEDDEADAVRAEALLLAPPALELAFHRELARGFFAGHQRARAITELDEAARLARHLGRPDAIEIGADLADALRAEGRDDEARRALLDAVDGGDGTEQEPHAAARIRIALAQLGDDPREREHHARAGLELAVSSGVPELQRDAAVSLGDLLFARRAFTEVEALLLSLPCQPSPASDALLEDTRRRLGRGPDDPTEDEEDEPAERQPDDLLASFVQFFTPPRLEPGGHASFVNAIGRGALLSSDLIRAGSHGRVTSESDLESQRIFGPVRSYWCACGRYRGRRYRGVVCQCCGVEVIPSKVRAVRTAHLELTAPVIHPWYVPAVLLLLDDRPEASLDAEPLRERLRALDLLALRDELSGTRPSRSPKHLARLAIVDAFIAPPHASPASLILETLPVRPPDADLDHGALLAAYAAVLFASKEALPLAVKSVFDAYISH